MSERTCPQCGAPLRAQADPPKKCVRCGQVARILVVSNLTSEVVCQKCMTTEELQQTGKLIYQAVEDHAICEKCSAALEATRRIQTSGPPPPKRT